MTADEAKSYLYSIAAYLGYKGEMCANSKAGEKMCEAIKTLEHGSKWNPVSEGLPKKTGDYLVSVEDLVTVESFDGHNFRTESAFRVTPDAWMPKPKPYEPEAKWINFAEELKDAFEEPEEGNNYESRENVLPK